MVTDSIIAALRSVLGEGDFPLHEPLFAGNEQRYLQECVASTYVSSVGAYVDRFERELADYTGARRAVAVVNGTAALQVALRLAGVQANDEVIVPALTFVATANAVSYLGAVPHFVDSDESTLGLNPLAMREWLQATTERAGNYYRNRYTGRRLRAVVPMHTFGHPCELEGLLSVAHDYRLTMVEDAAESLGSFYHGKHTGTFGLLGTLSFNGNKIMTTGGGGAILTNDEHLADQARYLTTTAKQAHRWDYVHNEIGYNFRMPNLNAALGCAQIERLPEFVAAKRRLYYNYKEAFSAIQNVRILEEPTGCKSNYWLQTMILEASLVEKRDELLQSINDAGLMARPAWRLLHKLAPYRACPRSPLPIVESLSNCLINIPSSAGTTS
jgi:perosamine synthetase